MGDWKPRWDTKVDHDRTVVPTCQTAVKPGAFSVVAESLGESGGR